MGLGAVAERERKMRGERMRQEVYMKLHTHTHTHTHTQTHTETHTDRETHIYRYQTVYLYLNTHTHTHTHTQRHTQRQRDTYIAVKQCFCICETSVNLCPEVCVHACVCV